MSTEMEERTSWISSWSDRTSEKTKPPNARTDVNQDGKRNIADLVLVARHLGELSGVSAAPSALALSHLKLDPAILRTWITQAQLENDGSFAFQQGIVNLQQLLIVLTPESTALLANYPNPFNPETWIPYELAEPATVTLRIYTISGTLVRTLHLGHQPAGNYQQRSRAAYWDGKNEVGESVASGVYFYTLTANDFNSYTENVDTEVKKGSHDEISQILRSRFSNIHLHSERQQRMPNRTSPNRRMPSFNKTVSPATVRKGRSVKNSSLNIPHSSTQESFYPGNRRLPSSING